jgi:hypothetical protein
MLSTGVGISPVVQHYRSSASAPPGISAAPVITDGSDNSVTAPIVGQTLFVRKGTYTNSPTSWDEQWYLGSTAIPGEIYDHYTPGDADIGSTITVKETARNGAGPSSVNASSATSAVADISL